MDQSKQLKFDDGTKTEVMIISMGMEEDDFGSKYVVHIKETIDGYDHFKPSDGLQRKMTEVNVGASDKIIIEKVPPSQEWKYGYFNVEMAPNNPTKTFEDRAAKYEKKHEQVEVQTSDASVENKTVIQTLSDDIKVLKDEVHILKSKVAKLELPF